MRQARVFGATKPKNTNCYYFLPFSVESYLSDIIQQAQAGANYYENEHCAFVWFSRVAVLADQLRSKITGEPLTAFTKTNKVYPVDLQLR